MYPIGLTETCMENNLLLQSGESRTLPDQSAKEISWNMQKCNPYAGEM